MTPAEQVGQAAMSAIAQKEAEIESLRQQLVDQKDYYEQVMQDGGNRIKNLIQQLAEKDAEIELERTARQQVEKLLHKQAETIAASQLQNTQLREALRSCYSEWDGNKQVQHFNIGLVYEALSLPTDTTALDTHVKQVIEACLRLIRHHGFTMGSLEAIEAGRWKEHIQ